MSFNTWIYNIISTTQITRFLLEHALIQAKQSRVAETCSKREVMAKLEVMTQCLRSFYLFQLFT